MRIEGLGPLQQPDPKEKKPEKNQKQQNASPDRVEIAKRGTKAANAGYEVKRPRPTESNRTRDFSNVKKRSSNGYYEKPEVRQSTSEKLIDSKELGDVVDKYHQAFRANELGKKSPEIRHDKVAQVKRKVAEGFYNNPQNYDPIAKKIIHHFGL